MKYYSEKYSNFFAYGREEKSGSGKKESRRKEKLKKVLSDVSLKLECGFQIIKKF